MFFQELEPILEHVTNQVEVTANEPAEEIVSNDEELEQEEEIVEEVIPRSQKMDTEGKPIGKSSLSITKMYLSQSNRNFKQTEIKRKKKTHDLWLSNTHQACCMLLNMYIT